MSEINLGKIASKEFLRESLATEQRVLREQLILTTRSIEHSGTKGSVTEMHFIKFLKRYLPRRYGVSSGIVIDHEGATSHQIDIIIYDPQYTPTLLDQNDHRYIPAEAVYAVFEIKQKINKDYLMYAGYKAKSVRMLSRTSGEFLHIGGISKKDPFDILAGIIAPKVDWETNGGISSPSFSKHLNCLAQDKLTKIDCGVALSDKAFDIFISPSQEPVEAREAAQVEKCGCPVSSAATPKPSGELTISPNTENSLAYFIFRLLGKLQSMGTAPAADWNRYAETISQGKNSANGSAP